MAKNKKLQRVLISAGGTGGHIFPGLAVAEKLQSIGVDVSWLGSERALDQRLVAHTLPFKALPMKAWRGRGLFGRLRSFMTLLVSSWQAWRYLGQQKPDVVLCFGGYVTVPVGLMARLRGIPLVIHEQNSVAGSANRLLARFAQRTMVAFPDVLPKARVCGNPLRAAFTSTDRAVPRSFDDGVLRVLVMGGSLGATTINAVVSEAVKQWSHDSIQLSVRHQTGESDYQKMQAEYAGTGVVVEAFIADVLDALLWADVVIARSGALTVSEIAAVGVASILVPYPKAIDDHQFKNAMLLQESGGAMVVREDRFSSEKLTRMLHALADDPGRCSVMADAAYSVHQPGAIDILIKACAEVASCNIDESLA